jgi:hypothetical protein
MSKANLIERLGADYCSQRMNGTLFNYKNSTYEFGSVEPDGVYATKYSGSPEKVKIAHEFVPCDFFENWKALNWPTLGYRQAANGQVIIQVGRRNSVQRGLNRGQLWAHFHPVSMSAQAKFGVDLSYFSSGGALFLMTMQPSYTKFSEGLEQVMKGTIPAFAVSADFAVAPNEEVEFLEVLFRGRRIGTISDSGAVKITAENIAPSWNKAIT